MPHEPLNYIVWREARSLHANSHNPNFVFDAELALIERSILEHGWLEPITINTGSIIIDGFHRWRLSLESPKLKERYNEILPCVVLDVPEDEALIVMLQKGRARGTHAAKGLALIVKVLTEMFHYEPEEIAARIAAPIEEIQMLQESDIFKALGIAEYRYSKAWIPIEDGRRTPKKSERPREP